MWLIITMKWAQLFRRRCLCQENYKGRFRFAKRRHFFCNCSLYVCAAVWFRAAAVWELLSLQRGLLLHLMMFYQLFCGYILTTIATLTLLSHTAINTQKPCLAFTTLLALPSAIEHFQFIRLCIFFKCFPGERKINILRDSYDIFCPLCRFWLPYHKTYTTGGKNTPLKKEYKITN